MTKPNILLILTDDQRFDTIAALGNAHVDTPHMDALVARGTSFDRCHIMGGTRPAVCCPSRAMLHTGRNLFHLQDHGAQIPEAHTTMGEHFRHQGYQTYGIGKWHNGKGAFARSFSGGGSIFFGGMSDHWHVPAYDFDPSGSYDQEPTTRDEEHSTDFCADQAIELIEQHDQSAPFFLSLAFLAPHDPRTMPARFLERRQQNPPPLPPNFMTRHPFDNGELMIRDEKLAAHPRDPDEIRQHLTEYHAMIDHLDEAIGWVIASHEARGMLDDTIIVFSGDNGLAVGQHGLMGKQSCYDHSLRVPMVLAGPGIPQGERRQQLCYLHDIFPTLCDLLGSSIPDSVTSRSFADRIRTDSPHRPELFAGYRDATRSLTRDDGWKLIVTTAGDGSVRTQLFHLPKDPWEQHDRSADTSCREILDSLQTALLQHSRQQQDTWAHRALVDRAQVATGS